MKQLRNKPRNFYPLGAALLAGGLLTSAGLQPVAAQRSQASPANTLVAGMDFQGGKSLDPARQFENLGNATDHAAYDTLVTFVNGDLTKPVPDLATKWTLTGKGTIYYFTLRSGVKFVSGNSADGD